MTSRWFTSEPVTHLRVPATGDRFELANEQTTYTVGRAAGSSFVVGTADQGVAMTHASVTREPGGWRLRDLGSGDGLWLRETRCEGVDLSSGLTVGLGRRTHVLAGGAQLSTLRGLLLALLGGTRLGGGLEAMRSLATGEPIVLSGEDDLVWIAERLQRASVVNGTFATIAGADEVDRRGYSECVVCMEARVATQPVIERLTTKGAHVVVCADDADGVLTGRSHLHVADLGHADERVEFAIQLYAEDAMAELGFEAWQLTERELHVVKIAAPKLTHRALADAARRMTALWRARSIVAAAKLLGTSHVALIRWLERRGLRGKHDGTRAPEVAFAASK